MNIQIIDLTFSSVVIFVSLLSIVFSFGVVWRVEKKLDTSYKLLLVSIICFTLSEFGNLFGLDRNDSLKIFPFLLKIGFAIFFLLGTLEMRQMLRCLDGEIKKK